MRLNKINLLPLFILLVLFTFSLELRDLRIIEEEDEEKIKEENNPIKPPSFSRISGFYPDDFKLKLTSEENTIIYYTLDSTDPRTSPTSKEFKDYILIYDKSSEPNKYSSIGTNDSSPVSITSNMKYTVPSYPVDKAMIVRAVSKNSKNEFSDIITKTYFVTNDLLIKYQDLTVISMVTNPENLFDPDIGIYVTGTRYQEELEKAKAEGNNNRWRMQQFSNFNMKGKEWEREAFVTIFEKGEINVQQNMGIRIKGAYTRNNPGKSFNLYAKEKYGKSKIKTDLLKDNYDINGKLITSYKSLSLRNIYDEGRLRDEFGRDLFYMREGLTSTNMKNAVLFLDGEYWGFYLIQEKIDNDFISKNYLIPSDNVVLAKANDIEDGPEEEFLNFNYFCGNYSNKDVSKDEIYSEIKNYIDINSFIELFATGIYISNLDWPGNNDGEWKYFGEPIEGNKYSDGKWRFIIYDLDYSMGADFFSPGSPEIDNFDLIAKDRRNRIAPINIFLSLIKKNPDFQNKFVNTICDYVNGIYTKEIINDLIEKYREECTDLVAYSQLRWSGLNYFSIFEGYAFYKTNYYKKLDSLRDYFEKRPKFIFQYMKNFMELEGEPVDLTIEIIGRGKVQVNSIVPKIEDKEWVGKYFSKIPVVIKAIPDDGFNFKEWNGYIQSKKENEQIILIESQKIIAVFD